MKTLLLALLFLSTVAHAETMPPHKHDLFENRPTVASRWYAFSQGCATAIGRLAALRPRLRRMPGAPREPWTGPILMGGAGIAVALVGTAIAVNSTAWPNEEIQQDITAAVSPDLAESFPALERLLRSNPPTKEKMREILRYHLLNAANEEQLSRTLQVISVVGDPDEDLESAVLKSVEGIRTGEGLEKPLVQALRKIGGEETLRKAQAASPPWDHLRQTVPQAFSDLERTLKDRVGK